MEKYVLALDQGTTSSRAVLFDKRLHKKAMAQREFPQHFPKLGWVEHNPMDIMRSLYSVINEAVVKAGIREEQIDSIGISNQRETVVVWERNTGKPVYNAIVWQCRRTAPLADKLIAQGKGELIREKTGLYPDAYFSGTKIKWILDNVAGVRERAEKGEILAGTIDSWIIYNLSGKKAHVTDRTNASRTMLYNIHTLEWDDELLELLDIPRSMLPEVKDCSAIYAYTDKEVCGFCAPIASAVGDQQAALFGQCCFSEGETKVTYGTGCFLLMNTGENAVNSKHRLLTTIALSMNGKVKYALEGSIFMGGALIKWLRDELGLISSAKETDVLAESVADSGGVVVVPAFTGLGAPYWDSYARGMIIGLTRGTTKAHICRAALEAIAFQVEDALRCMQEDSSIRLPSIKVDGGASVSDLLLQFQADMLNTSIYRPLNTESSVTGAAFLAGLATGFWQNREELKSVWSVEQVFTPGMDSAERDAKYNLWQRALNRSKAWLEQPEAVL